MTAGNGERWVRLRGFFAGAYEVELSSGRVRSRDRVIVDALGRARMLAGVELAQQVSPRGGQPRVQLCVRGHRRSFPVEQLVRRAGG